MGILAPAPKEALVKVALDTDKGRIVLALDKGRAPITTANFLAYVDKHWFDGQSFYRAFQYGTGGIIQGGVRDGAKQFPPIAHEAFKLAVRRASPGAGYASYEEGVRPWHSAMAATYAHGTAPLRRLADRYVVEAALAISAGGQPDEATADAFVELPAVMAKAEAKASQVERAALDLAEAVLLQGREGERFRAVVTDIDERGARIQICDPAVVARVDGKGLAPGDDIEVELKSTDVTQRRIVFSRIG